MKLIRLLPPAVALFVVGAWHGSQRRALDTLEQANVTLREQLAAVSSSGDCSHASAAPSDKPTTDKARLDWKILAGQLRDFQQNSRIADLRGMLRFEQRLLAMNREEIVAALDDIAALDLSATSRAMLEEPLVAKLILKDPELALTRFVDHLQVKRDPIGVDLVRAMNDWARKDPGKAATWFDQQIVAGKFDSKSLDGKSPARISLEGIMLESLLASDAAAAARRLAALPEEQRVEVMRNCRPKEECEAELARLVRDQLPVKDQAELLGQQAAALVTEELDYAKVTEYLDRIEATPAERTACVEHAALVSTFPFGGMDPFGERLDAMRQWVGTQAPELLDRVTAIRLGEATQGSIHLDFAEAAELAVQYSKAGGNDELIATFLETGAGHANREQARALAEKISDEQRRAAILKDLE